MPIVTIHGQRGSGVRALGRQVAGLLGADFIDGELLAAAAKTLGAPLEEVMRHDEHLCSIKERTARLLRLFLEKSALAGAAEDPLLGGSSLEVLLSRSYAEAAEPSTTRVQEVDDRRFYQATTGAIRELAGTGNVVVIGRGSQIVLRERPNALHVFLVGNYEDRVREIMREQGLARPEAERDIAHTERGRVAYFRKFFQEDYDNPLLYHLVLNTSRLSREDCARLIAERARALQAQPS